MRMPRTGLALLALALAAALPCWGGEPESDIERAMIDAAIRKLKTGDVKLQAEAGRDLCKIGADASAAVPALQEIARGRLIDQKLIAVHTLAAIDRDEAVKALEIAGPALLREYMTPKISNMDQKIRIDKIGEALRACGEEGAKLIATCLKSAEVRVRDRSLKHLGRMQIEARCAIGDIIPLLDDQDASIRRTAKRVLSELEKKIAAENARANAHRNDERMAETPAAKIARLEEENATLKKRVADLEKKIEALGTKEF